MNKLNRLSQLVVLLFSLGITACGQQAADQPNVVEARNDLGSNDTSQQAVLTPVADAKHPLLVSNAADIQAMRQAVEKGGLFRTAYLQLKTSVDKSIQSKIDVPVPKDAGGGYTHEQHKRNYQLMNNAGILFQITGEPRYAGVVKSMLKDYAVLYPTLGFHPEQKEQSPGKLFWQSLNEAVWLVYTIQAYDYIVDSLSTDEQKFIEDNLFRNVVRFLSDESPQTFDKVHNHGTWANAAVGMAGYVLDEPQWVEKALLGLDLSGHGGFLKQLQVLFSPDGYYNEGPYYQRYALMPFVLFAKAIEQNQPERKIFDYRDGILQKAIDTTIQLSYNGLFFPLNDAIKDKGIDTIELVYGVSIAYGLTSDPRLLAVAKKQNQILLTGDGLKVALGLEGQLGQPFNYESIALRDGALGDEGALIVMRANQATDHQTLVFKATSQGLGHGHFDKLNWLFYDNGSEIVKDYGAARYLNVEAKYGGHYLAENDAYAKQTIAHNTLVVDEKSHFNGKTSVGNKFSPTVHFFHQSNNIQLAKASMKYAYQGVEFNRTMGLVQLDQGAPVVIDVLNVLAAEPHQYDLPLFYQGQFISSNLTFATSAATLSPLGKANGYQYLWQTASAKSEKAMSQITWLHNGRFYTNTAYTPNTLDVLFTATGANDPNFNLTPERGYVYRVKEQAFQQFVNVLEPHGIYNGVKEFTLDSHSQISELKAKIIDDLQVIKITHKSLPYLVVYSNKVVASDARQDFVWQGQSHTLTGQAGVIKLGSK